MKTFYNQKYAISDLNHVFLRPIDFIINKNDSCLNHCSTDCGAIEILGFADQGKYRIT